MSTLLIEVDNPKVLSLLHELEELNLIRVLPQDQTPKPKLSSRLRGSISPQAADSFNEAVQKSRQEWERTI